MYSLHDALVVFSRLQHFLSIDVFVLNRFFKTEAEAATAEGLLCRLRSRTDQQNQKTDLSRAFPSSVDPNHARSFSKKNTRKTLYSHLIICLRLPLTGAIISRVNCQRRYIYLQLADLSIYRMSERASCLKREWGDDGDG